MSDDLRELYQDIILDHGKHPRNHRQPADSTHEAQGDNPMCGDRVTVYLRLSPDGLVEDIAFQGRGCAISQASASMMTELVKGKTESQVKALFEHFHALCTGAGHAPGTVPEEAAAQLQVMSGVRQFPMRVKCATLAWHTLNAAMHGTPKATSE